jgi:hypothetical protein
MVYRVIELPLFLPVPTTTIQRVIFCDKDHSDRVVQQAACDGIFMTLCCDALGEGY